MNLLSIKLGNKQHITFLFFNSEKYYEQRIYLVRVLLRTEKEKIIRAYLSRIKVLQKYLDRYSGNVRGTKYSESILRKRKIFPDYVSRIFFA